MTYQEKESLKKTLTSCIERLCIDAKVERESTKVIPELVRALLEVDETRTTLPQIE